MVSQTDIIYEIIFKRLRRDAVLRLHTVNFQCRD